MTEAYVGEIKMFAGNFAPRGYAFCDGQLLAISQNEALFSLFGTVYGGDGRTTFGLPDLRGRLAMHWGSGPGLTPRPIGSKFGAETATVNTSQLPSHTHNMVANGLQADQDLALNNVLADSNPQDSYLANASPDTDMGISTGSSTGGNSAHHNVMPFQCINFIVSLYGTYPSRT